MPELPEVETTRRGIEPHLLGKRILDILVREPRLRWPIPVNELQKLRGLKVDSIRRRGKYILVDTEKGCLLIHLGMSGSLRVLAGQTPPQKHDHFDVVIESGKILRFNDPRRFGCCLYHDNSEGEHKLLAGLGPEPLSAAFDGDYLYRVSRKRKQAVKTFIMDSHIVVGVGNIYASEALFSAGIRPGKAAGRISRAASHLLAGEIKLVLQKSIDQGGTTLRDFLQSDGKPGYFAQELNVYGRTGKPCKVCHAPIKSIKLGQRGTFYCTNCQK